MTRKTKKFVKFGGEFLLFGLLIFSFFQINSALADSDNLVTNPGAEAGDSATGWTITASGGNGWNMSTNWDGQIHSGSRVFRTSYGWGAMEQTVDLTTASGVNLSAKPDVVFSDWVNSRCNGSYYITYKLLDSGHNEIVSYNYGTSGAPLSISGSGDNSTWVEKSYTFTGYGTEARYAYVQQAGISSCMWAGYYGPHFDDASVIIKSANLSTVTLSAATGVGQTSATVNGNVTATGGNDPSVTVYWGTTDHPGTASGWDHSSVLGTQGVAAFEKSLESLSPGTKYYFTASATNSAGTAWPNASLNFTTSLPTLAGAPTLTAGTPAKFGVQLTAGPNDLSPATHLTYTWYRSADNAVGDDTLLGTGTTYTPVADDIGNYLIVVATSTDATGSESVVTAAPVINAGASAGLSTDSGSANLVASDGFANGDITFSIAKIDVASAADVPSGSYLIGDNYFQLTATDQDGNPVSSFNTPVTFTVSYSSDIETRYAESTLDVYKYENGAWTRKNCTLDTNANTITCALSSFSTYGVLGEEIPSNTNENSNNDIDNSAHSNNNSNSNSSSSKARVASWKAERYTNSKTASCPDKLELTIKGRHLATRAVVKIGGKEAYNVKKISSRRLEAKFCFEKLIRNSSIHEKRITVKNPGAAIEKAKEEIDLEKFEKRD
jgi:hypothetical protein